MALHDWRQRQAPWSLVAGRFTDVYKDKVAYLQGETHSTPWLFVPCLPLLPPSSPSLVLFPSILAKWNPFFLSLNKLFSLCQIPNNNRNVQMEDVMMEDNTICSLMDIPFYCLGESKRKVFRSKCRGRHWCFNSFINMQWASVACAAIRSFLTGLNPPTSFTVFLLEQTCSVLHSEIYLTHCSVQL